MSRAVSTSPAGPRRAWALTLAVLAASPAAAGPSNADLERAEAALATVTRADLEAHVGVLAGPGTEGRDSPSVGLERAARYIEQRFEAAGLEPLGPEAFRQPFYRRLPSPEAAGCALELVSGGQGAEAVEVGSSTFHLGEDFVPVAYCHGEAEGELVFCGYGIRSRKERYDELDGRGLEGAVALILEGEPDHPRKFDGDEVTEHATLWEKLDDLTEQNVAAVVLVRRAGPDEAGATEAADGPTETIGFRHTWASWATERMTPVPAGLPRGRPPVIEVTERCASALLGDDVAARAAELDRRVKARKPERTGRRVRLASSTREEPVRIDNVVGLVRGSDPELADEVVVLGAHYDHVGIDDRGRVGHGADDNASGTAALLELAEAFAAAPPARSVLVCAFAAEEDGLVGSLELCKAPPVPVERMVAMLNMDMIGRGRASEVAVIGTRQNPALGKVLTRALRMGSTGIRKTETGKGQELWARSDHYAFHRVGVPALFFFEGLPISRNPDYHTWRDTIDRLDFDKIHNTTRLVFQTAWLLANDAERPEAPRER